MRGRAGLWRAVTVVGVALGLLLTSPTGAAAGTPVSRCGNTSGRVLLTFDDWAYGAPYRIVRYARWLKDRNVGAVFFPIRKYAVDHQRRTGVNLLAKVRAQGMWVGNHTWSHPDLTRLSRSRVRWQIDHGVRGGYLRPPYGAYNARVAEVARNRGHRLCTWTLDTRDWDGRSAARIRATVREGARRGSVVLMHLQTASYDALPGIVRDLRAKGLRFCRPAAGRTGRIPYPIPC